MKKRTKTSLPKHIQELLSKNSPRGMRFTGIQLDSTMVLDDGTQYYQSVYEKDKRMIRGKYSSLPELKTFNIVTPSWCPYK